MATTREIGMTGEAVAAAFLRAQRYVILEQNYRCPTGEIDLIALHEHTLVFIEVKARHGDDHGSPLAAVDRHKQRRIQRAALYYMSRKRLTERNARFDVVGVSWEAGKPRCELVRDAFEVS